MLRTLEPILGEHLVPILLRLAVHMVMPSFGPLWFGIGQKNKIRSCEELHVVVLILLLHMLQELARPHDVRLEHTSDRKRAFRKVVDKYAVLDRAIV
jgi:hypothetical protein